MSSSVELCLIAVAALLYCDFLLISRLLIKRLKIEELQAKIKNGKALIIKALSGDIPKSHDTVMLSDYIDLKQAIQLSRNQQQNIENIIDIEKHEQKQIKRLNSPFKVTRMEAVVNLGLLATEKSRIVLEQMILQEKNPSVKLYMANALADMAKPESISILVYSLINSQRWYREKVNMLICNY
ncbi:MAG: HEAT repeat domain-containing protein, partial [Syntrophomonadaceae bacterium]|nr:HEAT repeat domain-containing protein [Syntrophomonadaceae bacterium]